jgi:hypothetical protein
VALVAWSPIGSALEVARSASLPELVSINVGGGGSYWLLAVAALLAPIGVWRGVGAARRTYHVAMPLAAAPHTLLKVACGWLWLLAGVALIVGARLATREIVEWILRDVPGTFVRYSGLDGGPWRVAVPFTAASIGYLAGSALVLASRHPWRVLLALLGAIIVSDAIADAVRGSSASSPVERLVSGRLGLQSAIDGTRPETRTGMSGVLVATRIGTAGTDSPSMRPRVEAVSFVVPVPDLDRWLAAAGLWLSLAIAAVVLAARRRRD